MQNSGGIISRLRNGARQATGRIMRNTRAPGIVRRAARAINSRLGGS